MEELAHQGSFDIRRSVFFGRVVGGIIFVVISLLLSFDIGGRYAIRTCPGGTCMTVS